MLNVACEENGGVREGVQRKGEGRWEGVLHVAPSFMGNIRAD